MFKETYRREMSDLHASESLIADTVKKMQEEQSKFKEQQSAGMLAELEMSDYPARETSLFPSPKTKRPLLMRIGLPVAACFILALLGVTFLPQLMEMAGQTTQSHYVFQQVVGNASLSGGLQLGGIDQQPEDIESNLRRNECPEELLPEGILEATPETFNGHEVYLGFDKQRAVYYATYLKETSGETWVVLQATDLDETDFIKALKNYFS